MSVRAKFRVSCIEDWGYNRKIKMAAVYEGQLGDNEENKRFTKATPNGEFWMTVDNPYAYNQFQIGQEWYLDCTLAKDVDPPATAA